MLEITIIHSIAVRSADCEACSISIIIRRYNLAMWLLVPVTMKKKHILHQL